MAPSILKLENKVYKTAFLAKFLNKKCYYLNFSLTLKLFIYFIYFKGVNIKL